MLISFLQGWITTDKIQAQRTEDSVYITPWKKFVTGLFCSKLCLRLRDRTPLGRTFPEHSLPAIRLSVVFRQDRQHCFFRLLGLDQYGKDFRCRGRLVLIT